MKNNQTYFDEVKPHRDKVNALEDRVGALEDWSPQETRSEPVPEIGLEP